MLPLTQALLMLLLILPALNTLGDITTTAIGAANTGTISVTVK
jgi:hypothetical protein